MANDAPRESACRHRSHPSEPGALMPADDCVEFEIWQSPRLPGLQVIHSNLQHHDYPAHLHDTLEVIWIRSGSVRLTCRDRTHELRGGEAVVLSPNEIHRGQPCAPGVEFVAIHVPRILLHQVLDGAGSLTDRAGNPIACKLLPRDQTSALLPILVRAICADLPTDKLLYLLRPILTPMLCEPPDSDAMPLRRASRHPAVHRAQSIIRDQCADRVDVQVLAAHVDLDMRYLITLFKHATGMTPHQYQIAMRVDLARCLIQEQLPLSEVAARAGFADQSHLNRLFKRHYGFIPGAFRESLTAHRDPAPLLASNRSSSPVAGPRGD